MIKVVLFDLDDTLISELGYIKSGYKEVSKYLSMKYKFNEDDTFKSLNNLFKESSQNVFNNFLEKENISYNSDDIKELVKIYRNHNPNIDFYDDVLDVFHDLRKLGIRLGIITDGYKETQLKKIEALGLDELVDKIIVTDELGREYWKPHPKSYQMMKEHFNVKYSEMIYIGDNVLKDFVSPEKLGMESIQIIRENRINIGIYKNNIQKLDELKEYIYEK